MYQTVLFFIVFDDMSSTRRDGHARWLARSTCRVELDDATLFRWFAGSTV